MRRVLIAVAVAGLLALGTIPVLARTANGSLEAQGEAALNAIKQARETCFDRLEATLDAAPVPESKDELAEALLKKAMAGIRAVGRTETLALKAALEAFDEDEDTGANDAQALQKAIADAKPIPDAIKAACDKADAQLKTDLTALNSAPSAAAKNDDPDEDVEVERERDDHDKAKEVEHEKKDHDKKHSEKDEHEDRD